MYSVTPLNPLTQSSKLLLVVYPYLIISLSIRINPFFSGNPYVKLVSSLVRIDEVDLLILLSRVVLVFKLDSSSTLTYWSKFWIRSNVAPFTSWEE